MNINKQIAKNIYENNNNLKFSEKFFFNTLYKWPILNTSLNEHDKYFINIADCYRSEHNKAELNFPLIFLYYLILQKENGWV
jgi:hypothetical protein